MRFISYGPPRQERAAIQTDANHFVDLESVMQRAELSAPTTVLRAFLSRPNWRGEVGALRRVAALLPAASLQDVRLGAPIPEPGQVLLAGVNYRSHKQEVLNDTTPRQPVVLGKMARAVIGPHDTIVRPPEIAKLDYEGEVAVVIGAVARRIEPAQVPSVIAGYTIMNDVSGRDLQLAEHETNPFFRMHFLGKSADTFAPMGPALVTADELDLTHPLRIRTHVDDELRQDGDTSGLIFSVEAFVSYVSQVATLYPGDVISLGTPGGVAHYMNPPRYLRDGQVCRVEVPGIGQLRNPVRDETVLLRAAA